MFKFALNCLLDKCGLLGEKNWKRVLLFFFKTTLFKPFGAVFNISRMILGFPYIVIKMKKNKRKATVPSFLEKTYSMLDNPEMSNIVSWSESGTEFVIKD
jgi:hypothetical protein